MCAIFEVDDNTIILYDTQSIREKETAMGENYVNHYVDRDILKGWSDDDRSVMWCNPVEGKEGRRVDIDNIYTLTLPTFPDETEFKIKIAEDFFASTLNALRSGEKKVLDPVDTNEREPFYFEYLRALSCFKFDYARYMGEKVLRNMNEYKGLAYYTVIEPSLGTVITHTKNSLELGSIFSLPIMDLKSVMLHAPEGSSFIVGATPINVINPYFEKRFYKADKEAKITVYKGTMMVLPISPSLSICLYDSDVYDFEGDGESVVLSIGDVDILNKVQLFSSEIDGGVVYSGSEEYIRKLKNDFPVKPYRTGRDWLRADRYPFWTMLSVMKVKDEAASALQKNLKSPMRQFPLLIKNYDAEWTRRTGKGFNRDSLIIRYNFAKKLIDGECDE